MAENYQSQFRFILSELKVVRRENIVRCRKVTDAVEIHPRNAIYNSTVAIHPRCRDRVLPRNSILRFTADTGHKVQCLGM